MRACLSTDAILAIGAALDWHDISDGLRHLDTCAECRAQLEALRLTHAGLTETESIDRATIERISGAVSHAARDERQRVQQRARWALPAEAFLGGITALIILASSGVPIESLGMAGLGFGLGAILTATGAALARTMAVLQSEDAHA